MKKNHLLIFVVIAVSLTATLLLSCSNSPSEGIEIEGIWSNGYSNNGYSNIEFTETSFTSDDPNSDAWDYSGDITSYSNSSFNIKEENPKEGDFGHLVVKITKHTGDDAQVGTFTVIRWKDLETLNGKTTLEFSEAYPAGWKSAEEAIISAKEETNFAIYSTLTKK